MPEVRGLAGLALALALALSGCSCETGVIVPGHDAGTDTGSDSSALDVGAPFDAGGDASGDAGPPEDTGPPGFSDGSMYDFDSGEGGFVEALCPPSSFVPTGCLVELAEHAAGLCNQLDDDCDGLVDEGCPCEVGAVQRCFRGPPARRGLGACSDGLQQCVGEEFATWGPCTGGIAPVPERCNGLDDDCNGCRDEIVGCVPLGECPGSSDPRVPEATPFTDYALRGEDFYSDAFEAWHWTVVGGPCDEIGPVPSFTLTGADTQDAVFHPTLSGDYTVTMDVTLAGGLHFVCTWIVHVVAPGLRVELCYHESQVDDLDLFLSAPGFAGPWYADLGNVFQPAPEVCGWADCEAAIRGMLPSGDPYPRADWGYAPSPIAACAGAPQGAAWAALGFCANPRLDIDNNLSEGTGMPENINVDAPREGDTFRVMVENFTGRLARPIVNVYCGGARVSSFGVAPDIVRGFNGASGGANLVGAMWRVADITTHVDASGHTTCDVHAIHPPGMTAGYDVSYSDARF
ncbi:MAG: hypothetical protein U0234_25890 [Sandaracinus sp.]